jgi:hypothetical protein
MDLNQAEDFFPARFFASFGTRIRRNVAERGKERNHETNDSAKTDNSSISRCTPGLLWGFAGSAGCCSTAGWRLSRVQHGRRAKCPFSLTTGAAKTAVGWFSLFSNAEGSFNTAAGAGALLFNTADQNTAFGAAALLFNTTGRENTVIGAAALLNNIDGDFNTATGSSALESNTIGFSNTAIGHNALFFNATGNNNTANR